MAVRCSQPSAPQSRTQPRRTQQPRLRRRPRPRRPRKNFFRRRCSSTPWRRCPPGVGAAAPPLPPLGKRGRPRRRLCRWTAQWWRRRRRGSGARSGGPCSVRSPSTSHLLCASLSSIVVCICCHGVPASGALCCAPVGIFPPLTAAGRPPAKPPLNWATQRNNTTHRLRRGCGEHNGRPRHRRRELLSVLQGALARPPARPPVVSVASRGAPRCVWRASEAAMRVVVFLVASQGVPGAAGALRTLVARRSRAGGTATGDGGGRAACG